MKVFGRRKPISWGVLTVGAVFVALAVYALLTGDAFVMPGRNSPSMYVLRASDPWGFVFMVGFYAVFGLAVIFLALIRVIPVEEGWREIGMRSMAVIRDRGYDSKPAPTWAYFFLIGFVCLIAWIIWKAIYFA